MNPDVGYYELAVLSVALDKNCWKQRTFGDFFILSG